MPISLYSSYHRMMRTATAVALMCSLIIDDTWYSSHVLYSYHALQYVRCSFLWRFRMRPNLGIIYGRRNGKFQRYAWKTHDRTELRNPDGYVRYNDSSPHQVDARPICYSAVSANKLILGTLYLRVTRTVAIVMGRSPTTCYELWLCSSSRVSDRRRARCRLWGGGVEDVSWCVG